MPKKKATETQEAQSERFREAVRAAVAAGELNPTEADERFDRLIVNIFDQSMKTPSINDAPD